MRTRGTIQRLMKRGPKSPGGRFGRFCAKIHRRKRFPREGNPIMEDNFTHRNFSEKTHLSTLNHEVLSRECETAAENRQKFRTLAQERNPSSGPDGKHLPERDNTVRGEPPADCLSHSKPGAIPPQYKNDQTIHKNRELSRFRQRPQPRNRPPRHRPTCPLDRPFSPRGSPWWEKNHMQIGRNEPPLRKCKFQQNPLGTPRLTDHPRPNQLALTRRKKIAIYRKIHYNPVSSRRPLPQRGEKGGLRDY